MVAEQEIKEIEVTPEMVDAAMDVVICYDDDHLVGDKPLAEIYQAMEAARLRSCKAG